MKAEIERLRWNVPRSPWAKFRSEEMLESLGWIRRNEKRQDSAATKWQELKASKKIGPSTRPLPRRSYNACTTPAGHPLERAV